MRFLGFSITRDSDNEKMPVRALTRKRSMARMKAKRHALVKQLPSQREGHLLVDSE